MHELGISRNIVAIVEQAAKGRRVQRVVVEIGELSGVMPDAIAFCFDVAAQGTPLEGCALEIRKIAGRARCPACERDIDAPTLLTACGCGRRDLVYLSGTELNVRSMVIEEAA